MFSELRSYCFKTEHATDSRASHLVARRIRPGERQEMDREREERERERQTESLHAGDCLRPTPQTKQSKAQLACGGVATAAPFGCVEEEKGRDRERERES